MPLHPRPLRRPHTPPTRLGGRAAALLVGAALSAWTCTDSSAERVSGAPDASADIVLGGGTDPGEDTDRADEPNDTGGANDDTPGVDDPDTDTDADPGEDTEQDTGDTVDSGTDADTDPPDGTADTAPDTAGDADDRPPTALECFADQLGPSGVPAVDYDGLGAVLGSHCLGTNHQDIRGVERVIFAGDSITVGTPPTLTSQYYRTRLALALADRFDLEPPNLLWQTADVINGQAVVRESGDFACCAKWGARTDDITAPPHEQLQTCAQEAQRDKVTLIVMTVGGNDFFAWAQDLVDGTPIETLQAAAEQMVADLEASVHWVVDDPSPFPNGAFVVFATNFEFTDEDSANDFATCPGAGIISMNTALVDPELDAIGAWVTSEYVRIAVETGTDVIFMGETFCGHGHMRDDPDGRCYRGPGTDLWLDLTCMHPGALGHEAIADMFMAVVDE